MAENKKQKNQDNVEINVEEILKALHVAQGEVEKWGRVANVLGKAASLVNGLLEQQKKFRAQQEEELDKNTEEAHIPVVKKVD